MCSYNGAAREAETLNGTAAVGLPLISFTGNQRLTHGGATHLQSHNLSHLLCRQFNAHRRKRHGLTFVILSVFARVYGCDTSWIRLSSCLLLYSRVFLMMFSCRSACRSACSGDDLEGAPQTDGGGVRVEDHPAEQDIFQLGEGDAK